MTYRMRTMLLMSVVVMAAACATIRADEKSEAPLLAPTLADRAYGEHERNVLDFWQADSETPTPVVIHMHGGGWFNGDKQDVRKTPVKDYLDAGISVVSINYRYVKLAKAEGIEPPVKGPMMDAARALQFVRSKAAEWNIDKERIGVTGNSAGACTTLWLALHDDLADPDGLDPVARESTRVWCAASYEAQTSLDPKQMKAWISNSRYGGHAFDVNKGNNNDERFAYFLEHRAEVLRWIKEYSPIEHASVDDPPVYLFYNHPPAMGERQKDPTHSANFGVALKETLAGLGVACELVYPGAPDVKHDSRAAYLIAALKQKRNRPIQIVLVGDSTMCEYDQQRPDRGWGMFLEEAFQPGRVEVHNLARGGRSTKTFLEEKRWKKALALKPNYVFIQFGHNDSHAAEKPEATDSATDYRDYLRRYVNDCRKIGATPILVTPMVRRTFHAGGTLDDNLAPYAQAMKAVADETGVTVIDLHRASWEFFEPLGPDEVQRYANKRRDRTHFNEAGARAMLGLILQDLPAAEPRLARLLSTGR